MIGSIFPQCHRVMPPGGVMAEMPRALFVPERGGRVEPQGAPGWRDTAERGAEDKYQGRGGKGDRVGR
jgi:hypothetical protein